MSMRRPPRIRLEDEDDQENVSVPRNRPPRPSTKGIRQSMAIMKTSRRARRRSSARFLKLSAHEEEEGEDMSHQEEESTGNLQELYKKAIRMNAENKINASNSWSLRLIENIDNFLEEDVDSSQDKTDDDETPEEEVTNKGRRVNFTKASCTLDASVKIYSYRVDDVYLSSYKVLANLNRNSNKNAEKENEDVDDGDDEPSDNSKRSNREKATASATLETNLSNINMNRLDSAFDIDPLFSKMSKTFDEGGAKGLLLANLGVSDAGCNIVFDSAAEADGDDKKNPDSGGVLRPEREVDISSLIQKLTDTLNEDSSVEKLALVPQLSGLRSEFHELQGEGFVLSTPERRKKRASCYGVSEKEEQEADRSIHQEALERSRASLARSFVAEDSDDDNSLPDNIAEIMPPTNFDDEDANNDTSTFGSFLGGDFDDGDDNDDEPFASRLSSISTTSNSKNPRSQTIAFLDTISNTQSLWTTENASSFWNTKSLNGNEWAGALHWKKGSNASAKTTSNLPTKKKKATVRKAGAKKTVSRIDFTANTTELKQTVLFPSTKKKSKASKVLSSASIARHTKNENLLPFDAGIEAKDIFSLFGRPDVSFLKDPETKARKTVEFADAGGFDDGLDDDVDNGPGFFMNDDNDDDNSVFGELEGVRKVEKVKVGYATVAKKVDVKRLKRDLWEELEDKFSSCRPDTDTPNEESNSEEEDMDASLHQLNDGGTSFKEAVQDMEQAKSQSDVSLPFYFICVLHLANEKGLRLESQGLQDFTIFHDENNPMEAE